MLNRDGDGFITTGLDCETGAPGVDAIGAVRSEFGGTLTHAIAEAERLNAPAPAIAELRASLLAAQQKDTHKNDHIASLLAEMRTAAARQDFATANRALHEAERLDIQSRDGLKAPNELNREQDTVRPPAKN